MTPILYRGDELQFVSNGLGRLTECSSCVVTEERNGLYECEFVYPVTGRFYKEMVENGGIIGVIHDDKHDIQPFDIYSFTAPIDGLVTFHACHISYRLNRIPLTAFNAVSCAAALAAIPSHSIVSNPFSFWTNKLVVADFSLTQPKTVRQLLVGEAGSLLDVYGTGEYQFDKWDVKLYVNRGVDAGVTIRYGKNLTDIERKFDKSSTYTAIAPYWTDGETTVTLPEGYVQSTTPPIYAYPWTDEDGQNITDENGNVIYFQTAEISPVPYDMTSYFAEQPSVEELRAMAQSFLASNTPWVPDDNVTVDFVALWQTPEYENVAALQRLSLCDQVSVYYSELGVVKEKQEVIKVVYNVLLERYDRIEIGTSKTTLLGYVGEMIDDLSRDVLTSDVMQTAIETATQKITGGLGGYVVLKQNANGEPEEILIMDTPDKDTAVNVWRFNQGGLGHSHNGYGGPYDDIALTMDGKINASMILTGYLIANFIKGGTLTLGGDNNEDGVWVVLDANGNEVARGDKDGVTARSLTATDYVYINAGDGSFFKMPLAWDAATSYFELNGSDVHNPFYMKLVQDGGNIVSEWKIGFEGFSDAVTFDALSTPSIHKAVVMSEGIVIKRNGVTTGGLYSMAFDPEVKLVLGSTTLNESQLQQLLALI